MNSKKIIGKIAKSNYLPVILLVAAILFSLRFFDQISFMANPVEYILFAFGNTAIYLFLINAYIPFVLLISPKGLGLAGLKKHRRLIGMLSYLFVVLHVATYMLSEPWEELANNIVRPFILIGMSGFLILSMLAVTSNNKSIKKLGKKNWKNLHRFLYLMIPILFLHISAKDKNNPSASLIIFAPLVLSYLIRLFYFLKNRNKSSYAT
ncbi:MAG: ferric reductase-like transmembrane domain-containing protein [SAR324 cluster bacterium]|nr:ferric reductase-like transmembrane domain-containing protein [SAR324 cluster bacterium]